MGLAFQVLGQIQRGLLGLTCPRRRQCPSEQSTEVLSTLAGERELVPASCKFSVSVSLQLQVIFYLKTCIDRHSVIGHRFWCSLTPCAAGGDARLQAPSALHQGLGPSELWAWQGIVEKGMWDLVFLELIEARRIVTAGESFVLRPSLSQQC